MFGSDHESSRDAKRASFSESRMELFSMLVGSFALAIVLSLLSQVPQALALASSNEDKVWDPYNITQLPMEIRGSLARMCGADLKAQRYFVGYFDNSRFLVLHFGRLHCGERTVLCTQSGCLHQVYERFGSRYRLLKSYYGPRGN